MSVISRSDPRRRKATRLPGYDYAQPGAYFVTACTRDRKSRFGAIKNEEMHMNDAGQAVQKAWDDLPAHYPHVKLDAFVVMPNHVHGIIILADAVFDSPRQGVVPVGAGLKPAPTGTTATRHGLPEIMRAFKTFSARRVNELHATRGEPLWQRSYYEHIIRNEVALDRIRQYVIDNPHNWAEDSENPDFHGPAGIAR